ncbi:MAG: hypothetical protein FJ144_13845 [Deltaproteobacteria bacterium]|nr:hypothetical protein [Deltaproteobacteria bacterium]
MRASTLIRRGFASSSVALAAVAMMGAMSACGGGGGGGSTTPPPVVDPPPAGSTFLRIQSQVLDVSCASSSCHSSVGRAANLVLEGEEAYDALVNAAPSNPTAAGYGMMRVVPGDPDKSYFYQKISGRLDEGMGLAMPWGGPYLTESALEVIHAWIAAGAPKDGVVEGDDGRNLGTDEDDEDVHLPPPERGVQITVTAPAIPIGKEETACHYLKMPSDVDFDVDRIQIAVSGGSHHIHLYRPFDPNHQVPDGYEVCNMAVDFNTWELVAASQLPRSDWELPDGVAYHFRAGEQLLVQTHFVNVGALETEGEGHVLMNLNEAEPGSVQHYAGSIFGQDRDVFVPAHSSPTKHADCTFPNPITIMAMTGHYHFRGRLFTTDKLDVAGNPVGPVLYHHEGYDDPLFLIYDDQSMPKFEAGEGLRWTCTWENDTDTDFKFGPFTDTNEHCNFFAFYYPAQGKHEATYCVTSDGVQTTTVRAGE